MRSFKTAAAVVLTLFSALCVKWAGAVMGGSQTAGLVRSSSRVLCRPSAPVRSDLTVEGYVYNADGSAAANVRVWVVYPDNTSTKGCTDGKGHYSFKYQPKDKISIRYLLSGRSFAPDLEELSGK